MPLKKSHGNMYDWVTHVHTHLGGECPHKCVYCYVGRSRFGRPEKYCGPLRLLDHELRVNYGKNRIIFIEHMNDLFAEGVPDEWIRLILGHCSAYPANRYVFQTKNPSRAARFMPLVATGQLIGTTIETNRSTVVLSKAPPPQQRFEAMFSISQRYPVFVTVEPVLNFDVDILAEWLIDLHPEFVNIGADSKHSGLPEPRPWKVQRLIEQLIAAGVNIRKKNNLERLIGG